MNNKKSNRLRDFFLSPYYNQDYLDFKKAQFVLNFCLIFFFLLIILFGAVAVAVRDSFLRYASMILPSMGIAVMSILLIKYGRASYAINLLVFSSCAVIILGFSLRPPHIAGVSMGLFMYMSLIFATLFSTPKFSLPVFIAFIVTHAAYYFLQAPGITSGQVNDIAKTAMLDGIVSLSMVYAVSFSASRFLNRAILRSKEETEKNRKQYLEISDLNKTIRKTSAELTDSIHVMSNVIDRYAIASQSQAASVEELTATMEEISASINNVTNATREQNGSVKDLIASIEVMSGSIDVMERYGKEIAGLFASFMAQAEQGGRASEELDAINNKILSNSNNIISVVSIMEDFFEKVNLLALNAAIEAARAGDHGRGFAVVAEEIGKMSDTSARDLKQISTLLERNKEDVEKGNQIITEIIGFIRVLLDNIAAIQKKTSEANIEVNTQKAIKNEMNEKTGVVKTRSEQIEHSMMEQKIAIEDVVKSIDETNKNVQLNTQSTEELRRSAANLTALSRELSTAFTDE
ncbi:MAG TPA: methyl-accepting chemotaxis protein [Spirochaetota bacterium]|nr:methyl-accepting chemotaxis protein [Spirochaetota bacterium]HPC39739.1 methyl-accepting chemotaxis protein [Spirochaetota bacterium]HPL19081.1 methyl-accepting chemotaxis protein [Spirochaetota bacterium]HQF07467.1 methyl-accepting chemotaxis protein [Spirochaetota bacterium]HQH96727.1 methyl-accepting chemotaxis protein [Spirochaetota bacterium]